MPKSKYLFLMMISIFILSLSQSTIAQAAKFDDKGEIISLRDILNEKKRCQSFNTFTGKISQVKLSQKEDVLIFQFVLSSKSKEQFFGAISIKEIARDGTPDDTVKPVGGVPDDTVKPVGSIPDDTVKPVGSIPDDTVKPVRSFLQKDQKFQIRAGTCGDDKYLTVAGISRVK